MHLNNLIYKIISNPVASKISVRVALSSAFHQIVTSLPFAERASCSTAALLLWDKKLYKHLTKAWRENQIKSSIWWAAMSKEISHLVSIVW